MTLIKLALLTFLFIFSSQTLNAQCFEIESILVDACGSPEGENEMVRFKIGNADLCSTDLTVNWPSANNWLGLVQNGTTASVTASFNASILGCGFLIEPTTCVLPANSTVILITSTAVDVTANSFANLNDTIYVIYQVAGNTAGHFKNYDTSTNLKTLSMSFSNPVGCSDLVTYDANLLLNINGLSGGNSAEKNGATVNFSPSGIDTYFNNGCQAPFEPFTLDLTATEVLSGTTTICPGDVIQVGVNIQGPFQEIIWTGFNGTFDAQDVATTNYNSTLSDNSDFYLYVGVVTICNDTIQDSVLFTINQSPTVNNAGPFTTFSGTQTIISNMNSGIWSATCGACIDANTGIFDPAVSGEGTFQICYDAGCGQDCIDIVVNNSCSMTWTISSSDPTCFESNDGDVTINISNAVGSASYLITNANSTQVNNSNTSATANNLIEGWYYFSVTDDLCTVVDSIFINDPDELSISYSVIKPNCYGIADGLAFVDTIQNYAGLYSQLTFQWSQGALGTNLVMNDSLYNVGENDYFLTVTDINNCQSLINFTVVYPDSIYFDDLDFIPSICRNQVPFDNGQGQVYASAIGGSNGTGQGTAMSYLWTEESTGITTTNSTWGNKNPGDYTIVATNDLGCSITATIIVDSLSPQASFNLTSNDFTSNFEGTAPINIELTNTSTNYAFSTDPNAHTTFIWSFGLSGQNAYVSSDINELISQSYLEEGVYDICLIIIENLNGCQDTVCQSIIVHDLPNLDLPNVFTPDGDGINDDFYFPSNAIDEFSCTIYDRWGKVVFVFNSITDKWNGENSKNGKPCTNGVYFYTYKGKSTNGTIYEGQGNVHLFRK